MAKLFILILSNFLALVSISQSLVPRLFGVRNINVLPSPQNHYLDTLEIRGGDEGDSPAGERSRKRTKKTKGRRKLGTNSTPSTIDDDSPTSPEKINSVKKRSKKRIKTKSRPARNDEIGNGEKHSESLHEEDRVEATPKKRRVKSKSRKVVDTDASIDPAPKTKSRRKEGQPIESKKKRKRRSSSSIDAVARASASSIISSTSSTVVEESKPPSTLDDISSSQVKEEVVEEVVEEVPITENKRKRTKRNKNAKTRQDSVRDEPLSSVEDPSNAEKETVKVETVTVDAETAIDSASSGGSKPTKRTKHGKKRIKSSRPSTRGSDAKASTSMISSPEIEDEKEASVSEDSSLVTKKSATRKKSKKRTKKKQITVDESVEQVDASMVESKVTIESITNESVEQDEASITETSVSVKQEQVDAPPVSITTSKRRRKKKRTKTKGKQIVMEEEIGDSAEETTGDAGVEEAPVSFKSNNVFQAVVSNMSGEDENGNEEHVEDEGEECATPEVEEDFTFSSASVKSDVEPDIEPDSEQAEEQTHYNNVDTSFSEDNVVVVNENDEDLILEDAANVIFKEEKDTALVEDNGSDLVLEDAAQVIQAEIDLNNEALADKNVVKEMDEDTGKDVTSSESIEQDVDTWTDSDEQRPPPIDECSSKNDAEEENLESNEVESDNFQESGASKEDSSGIDQIPLEPTYEQDKFQSRSISEEVNLPDDDTLQDDDSEIKDTGDTDDNSDIDANISTRSELEKEDDEDESQGNDESEDDSSDNDSSDVTTSDTDAENEKEENDDDSGDDTTDDDSSSDGATTRDTDDEDGKEENENDSGDDATKDDNSDASINDADKNDNEFGDDVINGNTADGTASDLDVEDVAKEDDHESDDDSTNDDDTDGATGGTDDEDEKEENGNNADDDGAANKNMDSAASDTDGDDEEKDIDNHADDDGDGDGDGDGDDDADSDDSSNINDEDGDGDDDNNNVDISSDDDSADEGSGDDSKYNDDNIDEANRKEESSDNDSSNNTARYYDSEHILEGKNIVDQSSETHISNTETNDLEESNDDNIGEPIKVSALSDSATATTEAAVGPPLTADKESSEVESSDASDISGGALHVILDKTNEIGEMPPTKTKRSSNSRITCSVVTWNLAEDSPSEKEAAFIRNFRNSNGSGSDLVIFGGQETENTKPRRSEGSRSRELRRILIKMLGKKYVPLALHSLGGVQFALFCKKSILGELEHVSIADVACGIGNVFHNKGAIGAFIKMKARNEEDDENSVKRKKSVKMFFVACHLAAHVKKVDARNADYWRIVSELEAQTPTSFLKPSASDELDGGEHLLNSMDHVIFCGDLNYRLDLPREVAERTVNKMKGECDDAKARSARNSLLRHDQLLRTISEGRAFTHFSEGEIKFPPTFKFDKGTKDYDSSYKQRIPAWTDRILFKSDGIQIHNYDSVEDATHSDHRPVHATMSLDLLGQEHDGDKVQKKRRKKRRKINTENRLD